MFKEGYESVTIAGYFSCVHMMILIPVRLRLDQACSRLPRSQSGWFCLRILNLLKTSGKHRMTFCPTGRQPTRYASRW
jgi:hypothetical protein